MTHPRQIALAICLFALAPSSPHAQPLPPPAGAAQRDIFTRLIRREDERDFNAELAALLKHRAAAVRERAAVAAGRIGDARATASLLPLLSSDASAAVRAAAAFALGEIEDAQSLPALLDALERQGEETTVRARAIEAVGKIAGAPANSDALKGEPGERAHRLLVAALPPPRASLSPAERLLTLLTITALLRARPPQSVAPLAAQLQSRDAAVRTQAANALARLRHPINDAVRSLVPALSDADAEVRAHAARALGVSRDASAVGPLLKLLDDPDERVQVSAVRALSAFEASAAVEPLLSYAARLLTRLKDRPSHINPLLDAAASLGRLNDARAVQFLEGLRSATGVGAHPEIEVALARLDAAKFLSSLDNLKLESAEWRRAANIAQGLAEVEAGRATPLLLRLETQAAQGRLDPRALPEILRALARLKVEGLGAMLRRHLDTPDVVVRATAATLLAESPEAEDLAPLIIAFERAKPDVMNDAKLALLSAIAKHKDPRARAALEKALGDEDHLVRRRAVELLKAATGRQTEYESRIGTVTTHHDEAFYRRVRDRMGKKVYARLVTTRGPVTIELFPDDAPLTVENFIALAEKGFFNGLTFHRVVPNFVIQGGDPRGDGEGGPGYQIRCEINRRPYGRGAVGMALSGKDTGGSQFFITHSPQPHLDGGYTVFGQVADGMDAVDRIARGDVIEKVTIHPGAVRRADTDRRR
jgi:cyclophilin family peptidyl-prolyl cis-trans isomerase/HEAT repeat protein